MPRIKDEKIITGRNNRNKSIYDYFNKRWDDGLRYDLIEDEIKLKWGVSASTISKILKGKI